SRSASSFLLSVTSQLVGGVCRTHVLLVASVSVFVLGYWPDNFARAWIEDQADVPPLAEVKHARERAGNRVERMVAHTAETPVVLDEAQDGGLIGQRVVDEVPLRVRGDHEQRKPRAVAAPALVAAERRGAAGTDRRILGRVRMVDDRPRHVVVPAVA